MVKQDFKPNRKAFIVIGLGYGDEGKGLVTDFLCTKAVNPIVIRFNGGQQAGHTVVHESGEKHVFANLGSGSFRNVPTYWSSYCTFSPAHFLDEYESLENFPYIFIDENCSITTHYDILFSQAVEISRGNERYGSCGLGFGATIERSQTANLMFTINDLHNEQKCIQKLQLVRDYYREKFVSETFFEFDKFLHDDQDKSFLNDINTLKEIVASGHLKFCSGKDFFIQHSWETLIFEGAQGILLDKDFGDQPYITKSNTTSRNAITILEQYFEPNEIDIEILYVTRAYATRHGAGPFWEKLGAPNLNNIE